MNKTWFITGASRGIGFEIAQAALAAGDAVVATARHKQKLAKSFGANPEHLAFAELDVQHPEQAEAAVSLAKERFGGIDVLINNAGFGQLGHFETVAPSAIEYQFATNVFGLMHVTRAVLPLMREQRRGHIFNLSSIGGSMGFEGSAIYCATKFTVEGFAESLALEVARFGIKVTIVEPGFFRTDFLDESSVRYGEIGIQDYVESVAAQREKYGAYSHTQLGDPAKLAALIVDVAGSDNTPLRLVAGSDALEMSRSLLDARSKELEAWADRSAATDHAEA